MERWISAPDPLIWNPGQAPSIWACGLSSLNERWRIRSKLQINFCFKDRQEHNFKTNIDYQQYRGYHNNLWNSSSVVDPLVCASCVHSSLSGCQCQTQLVVSLSWIQKQIIKNYLLNSLKNYFVWLYNTHKKRWVDPKPTSKSYLSDPMCSREYNTKATLMSRQGVLSPKGWELKMTH